MSDFNTNGGEGDPLAALEAELAADGADFDMEAALGSEGATEGAQDGEGPETAPAGLSGAALADRLTVEGDDELASLPPATLEAASAGLRAHQGPEADHVSAVADATGTTAAFVQTMAMIQGALEGGAEPATLRDDPAAAEVFAEDGELAPGVKQFLGSDEPLAERLRATWGRDTQPRVAAAMRLAYNDAVVSPELRVAFENAGYEDQAKALMLLDRVARKLRRN